MGYEAVVHATHRFIDNMPAHHTVVKLDFPNAFNSLHRDNMLGYVAERIPEIYKCCYSLYNVESTLQFGEFIILSLAGPHQGDPLSGILFCFGIQPILQATSSPFTLYNCLKWR